MTCDVRLWRHPTPHPLSLALAGICVAGAALADEVSATAAMIDAFEARCIDPMRAGEVPVLAGDPSPTDPSLPWNGYDGVIVEKAGEKAFGQSFVRNGLAGCTMSVSYYDTADGASADAQLAAFADALLADGFGERGACPLLFGFTLERTLYSEDRPLNGNHLVVLITNRGGFTPMLIAGESDEGYLPPCEEESG